MKITFVRKYQKNNFWGDNVHPKLQGGGVPVGGVGGVGGLEMELTVAALL